MTGPSKRELGKRVDELQATASVDLTDAEAYALLVAAASGDGRAVERWSDVDEKQRDRVTAGL